MRPTPKGGGIGILAAFVFASLILKVSPAFWVPACLLSFVSLLGDKAEIHPKLRLPIQFVAAIVFLLLFLFFSPSDNSTAIAVILLLVFSVFIVGTANWYNFMDGINGIAAITAIVVLG